MDFPVTRGVLDGAESFVHALASMLPDPVRVPVLESFRWEHPVKTSEAAQVAKAVRACSGLRAAMHLADAGYTVECGVLLRVVSDYSAEIIYLGEGLVEGRLTPDQAKFLEQHFNPMPTDPGELAAREREYYVGRKDIAKAHRRLNEKYGAPADQFAEIASYLNKGYDSLVHGTNQSAMELYSGLTNQFMLHGHESKRYICSAKTSVAGKLKEFLNALRIMAITRHVQALHDEINEAWKRLDASQEDVGVLCRGLK